ncbi:glycosyltransferase [Desulfococcaceae bacterium HSG7]|nr:glycosyltransferase [Desulfococcaceae bacterium HSG7]
MSKEKRFPIFNIKEPVSILMPVSNEGDVIESVVEEWINDVFKHLPEGSEMLFDEAASKDETNTILQRLSKKYPFIDIVHNEKKDGFANATRRLYKRAKNPLIFFTDSDGQYIAKNFWILAKFIDSYDIVRGAKVGRKDPLGRRVASFIFNKTVHFLFTIGYDDVNSAFHIVKKDVLVDLLPKSTVMKTLVNTEILLRAEVSNYSIKQCYVDHRVRKFGKSKGLPSYRFILDSLKAFKGLLEIKASYRRY